MIKKRQIDPIFKRYFGIETPIIYISDNKIQKSVEKRFQISWKRFYNRSSSTLSLSRTKQFDLFFRKLKKDGCDERFVRRVTINFINHVVGFGVFAKTDIPPYSTLNHYSGVLISDKDIEPHRNSTFSFTGYKAFSIDAMEHGNWCRFMNHCDEGDNVIPWEYYHESGPKIVFTSGSKGIKQGAQLLYSYGKDYWSEIRCDCLKL